MMIHVMRDGQQFGPYTLEDLNAYLAQGSLLATDQAWWEGAPSWVPMNQVPGVQLPGMDQPQPVAVEMTPEAAAVASPEVAVAEGGSSAGLVSALAGKKKILIIAGSSVGVAAFAGVILFVWPGLLKDDGWGDPSNSQASSQTGGNAGGGTFGEVVEPIFKKSNCYDCHSSSGGKVRSKLDLDKPESIKDKIDTFVEKLESTDPDEVMPPPGDGMKLNPDEIAKVKAWIAGGAKF